MKNIILFIMCLCLTGCASTILRASCGHITGAEVTIPYVGGKASGNAYGCTMACVGYDCPKPSTSDMATIMSSYMANASKDNSIKTNDGGTVTYIPPSK